MEWNGNTGVGIEVVIIHDVGIGGRNEVANIPDTGVIDEIEAAINHHEAVDIERISDAGIGVGFGVIWINNAKTMVETAGTYYVKFTWILNLIAGIKWINCSRDHIVIRINDVGVGSGFEVTRTFYFRIGVGQVTRDIQVTRTPGAIVAVVAAGVERILEAKVGLQCHLN